MPISVKCGDCGKGLKAPDALAGKKAKCPQCGSVIPIPVPVSDAEEYDDDPPAAKPAAAKSKSRVAKKPVEDEYEEDYEDESEESEDGRKACPMCGEMIIATAAKCRFCGEVFDAKAGKLGGRSKRKGGKLDSSDTELLRSFRRHAQWTGGFMIVISIIVAFAGIGLLVAGGQVAQQRPGFGQPPGFAQPQQIPQAIGVMGVVFIGLAAVWFLLGVFVCRKHLWAAYVTTGMSGLSLLGNLITKNIPGACGAGAILAESIIIGQKGRELNRRGIPLNSKP